MPEACHVHRDWLPLICLLGCVTGHPPLAYAVAPQDLTALSLEQLLQVTIVGASKYEQKQEEVAAAASVITRQEIQASGWRTLAEALSSLPGLYTSYNRQNVIVGARGFGLPGDFNTRLLLTIDGNRVNDPTYDAGRFGWDFPLDVDLIERIEFIPGPGGAVYGQNAMLGVVNVVTRTGAGLGGAELAVSYQQPQATREGRASAGHAFDDGTDVVVSISGLDSSGQNLAFNFGSLPVSGIAVDQDGQKDEHLFARVAHGSWSLEHVYGWSKKDDPTAAFFSTPLAPGESQVVTSTLTQLQYQSDLVDRALQLQARVFNGDSNTVYTGDFFGNYYNTRGQSQWYGGELRVLITSLTRHKLVIGLEGQDDPVVAQSVRGVGFVNPLENFLIQSPSYRVGVYLQDDWRIVDTLSATLGLREDQNNITGAKASPRAALIWQFTPDTTVKGLYGIAHRAPNSYERDYGDGNSQIANPGLQGESIDTFELVVDQRIGRDVTFRTSVYRWDMSRLITQVFDPASGIPPQYQSGENVQARGIEISGDKTWESGARVRGSVSLQHAEYAQGGNLLNSPERLGKLNFSQPLPIAHLLIAYELQYDSSRLTRDGTELGGYAVSRLSLTANALDQRLQASLIADNLFDKRYAQPGAENNWQNSFEQDGRSVRLKLSMSFL